MRSIAITGAARGIGKATAAALVRDGARVTLGDVDLAAAQKSAEELGPAASALELDVTDEASFRAFLERVEQEQGPLDVLVNNAGVMAVGPFLEQDGATAERLIGVNLIGTLIGMRVALPGMVERGRGQVVNLISAAAYVAPPGEATYAATKHGVRALTDAVRDELAGTGVTLTGVFPGVVDTELARGTRPPRGGRLISPDEIGAEIARAVRERRDEVYVPRSLGASLRIAGALPGRARALAWRLFAVDKVATGIDAGARADYMARTFGRTSDDG